MKNVVRLSLMFVLAFGIAIVTTQSFATPTNEKAIEKARAAVKNAAPDDWKTLAKSAKKIKFR